MVGRWIKGWVIVVLLGISPFCFGQIVTGAEQLERYLPLLETKKVALVVNQTSVVGKKHLVDTLRSRQVNIVKIFAPEHGFRGDADAGESIKSGIDVLSGLPVVSLYGDNKKPKPEQLVDVDVLLFDIQDVGVRFYTYLSTLHYVMEAAAEQGKQVIVLDRPNPNAGYIDGPILEPAYKSFVGIHPVPIVYGLTLGEFAQMINGEKWLKAGLVCSLDVVKLKNYKHSLPYDLPIKPSPNLPNAQSIKLYPSLCLFEGTPISVGRGTTFPFQVIGYPDSSMGEFSFKPMSIQGMSKKPLYENKTCYGLDLRSKKVSASLDLYYLRYFLQQWKTPETFFGPFFLNLAGTRQLQTDLLAQKSDAEIRKSWEPGIEAYKKIRAKYLLYKD